MPQIHVFSLPLADRRLPDRRAVMAAVSWPLDDLPLVPSLEDGVDLLHRSRRGETFQFCAEDDPGVVVAWRHLGRAALRHTPRNRRLVQIGIILLGNPEDDVAAVGRARSAVTLSEAERIE